MKRISIKGILLGGLVDIGSSFVFILIVVLAAFPHPALKGLISPLSLLSSALGGYVSARVAGHDELLNGALSALLCLMLGISVFAFGLVHESLSLYILLTILAFAFAGGGGYIRKVTKKRI